MLMTTQLRYPFSLAPSFLRTHFTGRYTMYTPHFGSASLHPQLSKPTSALAYMRPRFHTSLYLPSSAFYSTIRHFPLIHYLIQTDILIRWRHRSFVIHLDPLIESITPLSAIQDLRIGLCGQTSEARSRCLRYVGGRGVG